MSSACRVSYYRAKPRFWSSLLSLFSVFCVACCAYRKDRQPSAYNTAAGNELSETEKECSNRRDPHMYAYNWRTTMYFCFRDQVLPHTVPYLIVNFQRMREHEPSSMRTRDVTSVTHRAGEGIGAVNCALGLVGASRTSVESDKVYALECIRRPSSPLTTRDDDAVRAGKKTVEHNGAGIRWFFSGGHVSDVGS